MKRYLPFYSILLAVMLPYCDKDTKSDCNNTACTNEYRIITILIRHVSDSSAVVLSDFKVIRISDNKDISRSDDIITRNLGYYPLVSDSDMDYLRNSSVEIEFQGYIENILVIKRQFVVAGDCCHVHLVSGESVAYI